MRAVVILTTLGPDFDARALARDLVESGLAACVNIVDRIHSVYRWEGRVSADDEQLLLIKTTEERVGALRETLLAMHPYDVPEFVVIAVDSTSEAYGTWLAAAVE